MYLVHFVTEGKTYPHFYKMEASVDDLASMLHHVMERLEFVGDKSHKDRLRSDKHLMTDLWMANSLLSLSKAPEEENDCTKSTVSPRRKVSAPLYSMPIVVTEKNRIF